MRALVARASVLVVMSVLAAVVSSPRPAGAQATPGFSENFTTGLGGFIGGATYSNPGTGGVHGAADGYLRVTRDLPINFGTRSSSSGSFSGDYLAAKITHIKFWLNDVDASQDFAIHFGIGTGTNFWLHRIGFQPPENSWAEFEVDLTDSAEFVQIRGSASYAAALSEVDRILFRHDVDPITPTPEGIAGELGIDTIQLIGVNPVEPTTWGNIKAVFR